MLQIYNAVTLAFYKKEIIVLNAESISYYWTGTSRKRAYNSEGEKFPRSQSFNSSYILRNTVNNLEVEHINEHDKLSYFLSLTRDNYTCIHF